MIESSTLWIIHREQRLRGALARIAGAGEDTILGAPGDDLFDSASPARVVLLAPSGDFERELEFVHRFGPRMPRCTWILLPEPGDLEETRRLFDSVPASFLRFPPEPDQLRHTIHAATHRRTADSLSRRRERDRLVERFSRWFADIDLPDLFRALDPSLSHLPLLIRGERGTGSGLIARYIHAFGSSDDSPLRQIPCRGIETAEELLSFIDHVPAAEKEFRRTLWFEDVHLLPTALQCVVRDWVEYGLPDGTLRASNVRWIASADDEPLFDRAWAAIEGRSTYHLDADLAEAFSGLFLRLPPLRERPNAIEPFIADTALAWANAKGERMRSFREDAIEELCQYPWPGNMEELENVVERSLALSSANPLEPHHLRFHGHSPWSSPSQRGRPERPTPHRERTAGHRIGPPAHPLTDFEETTGAFGEESEPTELAVLSDDGPDAFEIPTLQPEPLPLLEPEPEPEIPSGPTPAEGIDD